MSFGHCSIGNDLWPGLSAQKPAVGLVTCSAYAKRAAAGRPFSNCSVDV